MRRAGLLFVLLAAGCGYTAGAIVPGNGRTIAVPVFRNETFRRDLERDLTRHVAEEIRSSTTFRLVDVSSRPDLVLEGTLLDVSEDVLSERSAGEIRETSVTLTVSVTVTDPRTGEAVAGPTRIREREAFTPLKDESIRTAEAAAMRKIAARIVYTLARDW